MALLEWINLSQNLPHQFSNSAEQALQLAKLRDPTWNKSSAWGVWKIDGNLVMPGGSAVMPQAPLVRNPATGQYDYIPLPQWTIDNVVIGNRTLNQIFNPAAPPLDQGPGVATPWTGGPNDPQVYVPPVVPIIGGGGPDVEPVPATAEWWIDLIDRVDAAAAAGTLTAAGLQAAVTQLTTVPQPRPALVEAKIADWSFILSNHLLDPAAGFAPVRVVVEGRGRMVYNQGELNQALAAGGYVEPLDGPQAGGPAGVPATASSSPSLLTWGVIAAAALFALRGKKGG